MVFIYLFMQQHVYEVRGGESPRGLHKLVEDFVWVYRRQVQLQTGVRHSAGAEIDSRGSHKKVGRTI